MINLKSIRKSLRVAAALMTLTLTIGAGSAFARINIDGFNDTTGPFSENDNEWNIDDNFDFQVDNTADALNDIGLDVNSGRNDISNNTEVCDVLTGDILGDFEIVNELNNEIVDLGFFDWGDIDVSLGNELTGPNSENENEVNIDQEVNIDIDNIANIDNDLDYDLNTGENDIDHNTVVGFVETGDINIATEITNIANENVGDIDLPEFGTDISADFSNELTGPNSENENELNIDTDFNFDLQNDVNIDNNIDFDAETGNNNIGNNTVVDGIRTGDIKVRFDIVNQAN